MRAGFYTFNQSDASSLGHDASFKTKDKKKKKASKAFCMESCKRLYSKMAVVGVFFLQIAEVHVEAFTLL